MSPDCCCLGVSPLLGRGVPRASPPAQLAAFISVLTGSIQRSEMKTGMWLLFLLDPNRPSLHKGPQKPYAVGEVFPQEWVHKPDPVWAHRQPLPHPAAFYPVLQTFHNNILSRADQLWCSLDRKKRKEKKKDAFWNSFPEYIFKISVSAPKFLILWSPFLECDTSQTWNRCDKHFWNV